MTPETIRRVGECFFAAASAVGSSATAAAGSVIG